MGKKKKKNKKSYKKIKMLFNVLKIDKPNYRLTTEEIIECYKDQLPE